MKSDRPPTLAMLRREAARVYGPAFFRIEEGVGSLWRISVVDKDTFELATVRAHANSDARRALMAALKALPDWRK